MATRFPESDASITTWCPYCGKLQRIAKFCCVWHAVVTDLDLPLRTGRFDIPASFGTRGPVR